MAEDDHGGREHDRRQRPPGEQPVANVAGHCIPQRAPTGSARAGRSPVDEHDADRRRDQRDRHQRHRRAHGRRQHEQDDDGEDGLHDLPGGALPRDGPQGAADVAHVAPVADAAVDVADDAAREREVEEQRPVVGRDGGGQRQVDAEPARDDRPPPRTADRGERRRWPPPPPEPGRRPRGRRRGTGPCRAARRRRRASRLRRRARAHAHTAGVMPVLTAAPAGRRGRR